MFRSAAITGRIVVKLKDMKLKTKGCDIIGIAESWANETVNDAELFLSGYNMFRIDKEEANGIGEHSSLCTHCSVQKS